MADGANAPIWVTLVTPVIAALATWGTARFELLSFHRVKPYEGTWYAYYRDPDNGQVQEEIWTCSRLGKVTVTRGGRTTFKGKLSLRGGKAYMDVVSVISGLERLFVMLDTPANPRNGDGRPSVCIWLGNSGDQTTTAGHGQLSREPVNAPNIKDEFIRATR